MSPTKIAQIFSDEQCLPLRCKGQIAINFDLSVLSGHGVKATPFVKSMSSLDETLCVSYFNFLN